MEVEGLEADRIFGFVSSEAMKTHRETAEDFLWMGREGLMMTGTKFVLLPFLPSLPLHSFLRKLTSNLRCHFLFAAEVKHGYVSFFIRSRRATF